jgi:hypothetical protein
MTHSCQFPIPRGWRWAIYEDGRGKARRVPSLTEPGISCLRAPSCRDFLDLKADARIRTADPFITSDDGDIGKALQIGPHRLSQAGVNPR